MNMFIPMLLSALNLCSPSVQADLASRRATLPEPLFTALDTCCMTRDEREAMAVMYAYMPLPDLAGHGADFHLANVRASLRARGEMPWGDSVPEREFRHFVLPVRVNNEALDLSRPVMYEQLKDRVKGLSMRDAILEVNHWCHEHVTYKPSDARTSPPLSTMSQAIGRCGEQSTFAVAALRAVGIPARQVYTPRWAHTDDNHAWVEAWADGRWYFLGACEPAPVLDMAWFNAPASRGMMMTTNVFGKYDGPEEQLAAEPLNTTINVTSNYAPVAPLAVRVVDSRGLPVENARVAFSIYNYTEFFPAAVRTSDAQGRASVTAGMGNMLVWASDGKRFGWSTGRPGSDEELTVTIDKDAGYTGSFDLTITPPAGSAVLPQPSALLTAANDRRLQYEDSVRHAYEDTFVTREEALALAAETGMADEADRLASVLADARGNSRTLGALMASLAPSQRLTALSLLEAVTEKDRRDIPAEVVADCLTCTEADLTHPLEVQYVLSPRILTERLVPFRQSVKSLFGPETLARFRDNPDGLAAWVSDNIVVETSQNPKAVPMDPLATLRAMRCDPRSRDILFVAVARTAGIPSRIDPVTGKVQYRAAGSDDWSDVSFDTGVRHGSPTPKGTLRLDYRPSGRNLNPRYFSQFSISRIDHGVPSQLEYGEEDGLLEIAARNEPLDCGQYMLVTGQRLADGSVLAHGEIFSIAGDAQTTVPLIIREDTEAVKVIGSLNAENLYRPLDGDSRVSLLSTAGRGYYVVGFIKPGHEPSAHALNDLSAVRGELESWGRSLIVLFEDEDAASRFDAGHFTSLPSNVTFGIDPDGRSLAELVESLNLPDSDLPVFVVADSFNRVVHVSQGYTIGLGKQLLDVLDRIE